MRPEKRFLVDNVEFRLGEIEHLPVESGGVDAIISNCVLNLLPDKALTPHMSANEVAAFRASGVQLKSVTVLATKPSPTRD
jgi:hypothetical protein